MSTGMNYAEHHKEEIDAAGSLVERIANATVGRALGHADTTTIFGEPTQQGDRTVIPVGRVSARYGFGGGSGTGTGEEGTSEGSGSGTGGGGGGGGMVNVKPVGYIEITPGESRFVPIVDASAIAVRAVTVGSIVAVFFVIGLFRTLRALSDADVE
jgi:uncharacterized spore protein YtfJ